MSGSAVRSLAIAVVALIVGFAAGTWRAGPTIEVGGADLVDRQLYIETDHWSYGGTAEVAWLGATNTWNDSGVPECLESGAPRRSTRFASIEVTIEGQTWRPVIWIDCRG